jgi:hypothetical protein
MALPLSLARTLGWRGLETNQIHANLQNIGNQYMQT